MPAGPDMHLKADISMAGQIWLLPPGVRLTLMACVSPGGDQGRPAREDQPQSGWDEVKVLTLEIYCSGI